ncbi:MAG TPA: hypothetical protein VGP24_02930 [Glaciihabitans sp.]|nr:hypothetical protein [Glaciihabitans sp.]
MATRRKSRYQPPKAPNLTPWWVVAILILLTGATLVLVGIALTV